MNIINIEHISKLFGDKLIFDDASFGLQEGDKVGIVGINGTGKSTLLRMVAGEETPDSGQIIRQNNLKMAYLPQTPEFPKDATVLSYALSGDEEDWQVQSNLVQLGITEYDAKLDTLSGGQRRRIDIARALLHRPRLLLRRLHAPTAVWAVFVPVLQPLSAISAFHFMPPVRRAAVPFVHRFPVFESFLAQTPYNSTRYYILRRAPPQAAGCCGARERLRENR